MSGSLARRVLWFEGLESRRVLAAGVTFSGGIVTVEGTHKNDKIAVSVVGPLQDKLSVVLNKSKHLFALDQVSQLNINAGAGNDCVAIARHVQLLAIVSGGNGNDYLQGGGGRNELFGDAGNDVLIGGWGDDVLVGGAGNDKLSGLAGQDHLEGGAGNDWLDGGAGDDLLLGDAGNDKIAGGQGNDEIWGGAGNDCITAGAGDDLVHGEAGNDKIDAGHGDDTVFGEAGNDTIFGGAGNDWLDAGDGNDNLSGGHGDDSLKGGAGNDCLDGGKGTNLLDGDEGRNKLKNGIQTDLDQPPPPDEPEVVEYHTVLDGDVVDALLVYTKVPHGNGFKEVLVVYVNNADPDVYRDLSIEIKFGEGDDEVVIGSVPFDPDSRSGEITFSTVPNQPHEHPFPAGFQLEHGTVVWIADAQGTLNLTKQFVDEL